MSLGCAAVGTVLAIDIGGTKMAAGVVDDAGNIAAQLQAPTPADGRGGSADARDPR